MNKTNILNFSLGPVQGFIARARKTRDFWTGSFLLSYLAGQAMAEILKQEGSLILPAVAENKDKIVDPLLQAIIERNSGKGKKTAPADNSKLIATLPNRFRARIPADFNPDECVKAIKNEWQRLTQKIWDRFLAQIATYGNSTAEIWRRQTENYWEINWVLGENPSVLEQRKNWRSHLPTIEHGDKCTLFGDLQELSGYLRIHENKKQKRFWEAMQQQVGIYDLEENERLCAIALVKRLFPRIAAGMFCQVPTGYPSTPYLAAVNWIGLVAEKKPEDARKYAVNASRLPGSRRRENPELFSALQQVLTKHPHAKDFASLDGNCFFKTTLENPNLWDKPADSASETERLRKELVKELADLNGTPPSPFYAMLLMDGDRLGALLQKHSARSELISSSLSKFSSKVPSVIESENGVTVFAGGDDVLALLPLENAMAAATSLRQSYLESFADKVPQATISGAIVYAHFTTPFTEVYHEAQRLLEVAKDKTGRDSLAVTIWKSAGKVLTWSAPWESILDQKRKVNILEDFMQHLQKDIFEAEKSIEFSNSFFYNIQSRLALFSDEKTGLALSSEDDLEALLTAEYIRSRGTKTTYEEAQKRMKQLFKLCRYYWRDQDGKLCQDQKRLQLESVFLVKFLAEKGVER